MLNPSSKPGFLLRCFTWFTRQGIRRRCRGDSASRIYQSAKTHITGTDCFARPACEASVHMQHKALIHGNTSCGNSAHEGNAASGRIGFGLCNAIGGAMREAKTARDAMVGFVAYLGAQ